MLPPSAITYLPFFSSVVKSDAKIKASSVLSVITVFELHKAANAIISDTFKFLEMLFAQAVLYVAFVVLMTQLSIYLEKRIGTRLQIKNFSQR